ncbi:hypothetical protein BD310DRAFT_182750 [Dichomitus squalens]|uniref:Uncharacterized protein n=1 Tax=Dichomitus squalens TaxID=114155 RepID=A0A4Q9PHB8_9APHY|nr:hypothetical protein BD310DRAFT_182750 [Dichomitus squalens]
MLLFPALVAASDPRPALPHRQVWATWSSVPRLSRRPMKSLRARVMRVLKFIGVAYRVDPHIMRNRGVVRPQGSLRQR